MKITREHERKFGKATMIQLDGWLTNSVVIRKGMATVERVGQPETWGPARIVVLEQHITAEEAVLLQEAIGKAIEELRYLDEQYPVGNRIDDKGDHTNA